jgi:uncharacterized membrane protein (UPF0127 family)
VQQAGAVSTSRGVYILALFQGLALKVENKTRNILLASDAELADSLPSRMKGLLGRDCLGPGGGMIITPCTSIHTFGMRFSIDAIFYDRHNRALAVIKGLRPYRLSGWHPQARGVIELPAGTLTQAPVEPGDQLDMR